MSPEVFAFTLTLLAGLATGVGSALAFFMRRTTPAFLATSLGFSAGVMLYVSFVEILPKSVEALEPTYPGNSASWIAVASFFGGIALIGLIDFFVPEQSNPHEFYTPENFIGRPGSEDTEFRPSKDAESKLLRLGVFTALALAIHNFPEGFATFMTGLQDPELAIPVAIAIAIHNIPEGIAVSVPIYYATGSRRRAFGLSFASGLSEPAGALIGWLLLRPFMSDTLFGVTFAGVAGIMVYISLDELLPSAERFGKHHHAMIGLIAGMAVMALSLLLLA
ncbi:MAG: zinc transporter ZupT [Actinomycetaceae bacterium]|nr:zinc transporter ZupT [Actinomycetaceae bacterium]